MSAEGLKFSDVAQKYLILKVHDEKRNFSALMKNFSTKLTERLSSRKSYFVWKKYRKMGHVSLIHPYRRLLNVDLTSS